MAQSCLEWICGAESDEDEIIIVAPARHGPPTSQKGSAAQRHWQRRLCLCLRRLRHTILGAEVKVSLARSNRPSHRVLAIRLSKAIEKATEISRTIQELQRDLERDETRLSQLALQSTAFVALDESMIFDQVRDRNRWQTTIQSSWQRLHEAHNAVGETFEELKTSLRRSRIVAHQLSSFPLLLDAAHVLKRKDAAFLADVNVAIASGARVWHGKLWSRRQGERRRTHLTNSILERAQVLRTSGARSLALQRINAFYTESRLKHCQNMLRALSDRRRLQPQEKSRLPAAAEGLDGRVWPTSKVQRNYILAQRQIAQESEHFHQRQRPVIDDDDLVPDWEEVQRVLTALRKEYDQKHTITWSHNEMVKLITAGQCASQTAFHLHEFQVIRPQVYKALLEAENWFVEVQDVAMLAGCEPAAIDPDLWAFNQHYDDGSVESEEASQRLARQRSVDLWWVFIWVLRIPFGPYGRFLGTQQPSSIVELETWEEQ